MFALQRVSFNQHALDCKEMETYYSKPDKAIAYCLVHYLYFVCLQIILALNLLLDKLPSNQVAVMSRRAAKLGRIANPYLTLSTIVLIMNRTLVRSR